MRLSSGLSTDDDDNAYLLSVPSLRLFVSNDRKKLCKTACCCGKEMLSSSFDAASYRSPSLALPSCWFKVAGSSVSAMAKPGSKLCLLGGE